METPKKPTKDLMTYAVFWLAMIPAALASLIIANHSDPDFLISFTNANDIKLIHISSSLIVNAAWLICIILSFIMIGLTDGTKHFILRTLATLILAAFFLWPLRALLYIALIPLIFIAMALGLSDAH